MSWPVWSKKSEKELARYVLPQLEGGIRLGIVRDSVLAKPGGTLEVARAIYEKLADGDIRYAREPYDPRIEVQHIRDPDSILIGAGDGTCLDLALLYAGICLGKELLPLVVVLEGHAFVAVSQRFGRRDAISLPRRHEHGGWVDTGLLADGDKFHELVESGDLVPIECTGFARDDNPSASEPEGIGRDKGRLTFERAMQAGREQLGHGNRGFLFAIDPAVLQDGGIEPYEPPSRSQQNLTVDLRRRLSRLFETHRLFGGRDAQLAELDRFVEADGGYLFVTGGSGSGKTALLANWTQTLIEREDLQVAFHFISRQHGLAYEEHALRILCQQLAHFHGRSGQLPGSVIDLQALYLDLLGEPPAGRLIIVVDGLDEAQDWSPAVWMFPPRLPKGLSFVFSARKIAGKDEAHWLTELGLPGIPSLRLEQLDQNAIAQLLVTAGGLAARWATDAEFVATLREKSDGDSFYLRYLVEDIAKGEVKSLDELKLKQPGLNAYFDRWWDEIKNSVAEHSTSDLLGYLLVSRGSLTRDDLTGVSDKDQLNGYTVDKAIEQVKRYVVGDPELGYSLCHPRFKKYVGDNWIKEGDRKPYFVNLLGWCERWPQHRSAYALLHYADHLAELLMNTPEPAGYEIADKLAQLVTDKTFQNAFVETVEDLPALQRILETAVRQAAAMKGECTLPYLTWAALGFESFRVAWLDPDTLFILAAQGDLDKAEKRLDLYTIEQHWRQVISLLLAWNSPESARDSAKSLKARAAGSAEPPPTLALLLERVEIALGEKAMSATDPSAYWPDKLPYWPGKLHEHASEENAELIVQRMGGALDPEMNISGSESFVQKSQYGEETPQYIAEGDSPWLVGYAAMQPDRGDSLLREYIGIHSRNPYHVYRNRSLWGILGAVLCHPDPDKSLAFSRQVALGALQPSQVRFRESLKTTVLGLQAAGGETSCRDEFMRRINQLRDVAEALHQERWKGDTWGNHCRRYAALAEASARALGDQALAGELLTQAMDLPRGFAGFQSLASLTLAEAWRVCRPGDTHSAGVVLQAARRSAHNIQEPSFCARTTAWVNAMCERWAAIPGGGLADTIIRFARNPQTREFAPFHRIGEAYVERAPGKERLDMKQIREASTLSRLAMKDIFDIPVAELERLNPEFSRDQPLPVGLEVAIPDSGFPAVLAARLSAEVLADGGLSTDTKADLVRMLVPVAVVNPTALDVVLSRLLLASCPISKDILDRLDTLSPATWMVEPGANPMVES